jgi:hypothetical protein
VGESLWGELYSEVIASVFLGALGSVVLFVLYKTVSWLLGWFGIQVVNDVDVLVWIGIFVVLSFILWVTNSYVLKGVV